MYKLSKFKVIAAVMAFFSVSFFVFGQHFSDRELKKNVIPVQDALVTLQKLEPKKFEYNTDKYGKLKLPSGKQYGFIAEDVQQVLPDLIRAESRSIMVGKNNYQQATLKTTDLESMVPLLVAAIQEQQKQIDELKQQVEAQRN
ncbi:tail fiber domain-containing protein [Adhaeribacter rhizoryzae]|uniref:Tail fiber domain-containing protein n=1 Tax=Adhaeribacter rhizoryzae TaxID=2607907 RepID=A0A5M6DAV0_9BACT|nr:tail fiber domain-containing protein [Adhaeribacter rhizoryzae]KAA5543530.1 tail fiber domain-containing protein [Adhaeribacter rhizoryzae]